jgi:hypothetical protein
MIIKGKSRAGPGALAAHLGNAEKNERVSLVEVRGTVADDLRGGRARGRDAMREAAVPCRDQPGASAPFIGAPTYDRGQ